MLKKMAETLESASLLVFLGVFLLLTGCLGTVFNMLIIVTMRCGSRRLTGSEFMLLESLCWSQLLMALCGNHYSSISAFSGRWILGKAGCSAYGFWMTLWGIFGINILTAIAVERYICICVPSKKLLLTSRMQKIIIMLCFVGALPWSVFPFIGVGEFLTEGIGFGKCPKLGMDRGSLVYAMCMMIMEFFLPVVTICICYANILITVRQSKKNVNQHGGDSVMRMKLATREKRMAITLGITIGTFIIAWGPYTITTIIYVINQKTLSTETVTLSAFMAKCAPIWNPIIFVTSNSRMRKAMKNVLMRRPSRPSERDRVMVVEASVNASQVMPDLPGISKMQYTLSSANEEQCITNA